MILYSVTVSIERDSSAEWLEWMTSVHIPDVMKMGYFRSHAIRRVLEPHGPTEHVTYEVEYSCDSLERYEAYQNDAAPELQRDHTRKFSGRFTASRRVLEIVR